MSEKIAKLKEEMQRLKAPEVQMEASPDRQGRHAGDRQARQRFAAKWKRYQTLDPAPEDGLHVLDLQTPKRLEDTYRQAELFNDDYPKLVPEERPAATIAVSSVLAVYKVDPGQTRYRRLERCVKALVTALPRLQQAGGGCHS
ncbi:MAG: hypothetical protein HC871_05075 [Rhizobiales bacterium]|nr:hypothetical protein [Hyphomicrobiales bacterium]